MAVLDRKDDSSRKNLTEDYLYPRDKAYLTKLSLRRLPLRCKQGSIDKSIKRNQFTDRMEKKESATGYCLGICLFRGGFFY